MKYILNILLIILSVNVVSAQKILKTKSGQKVLIAKDGSWSLVKKTETVDENGNIIPAESMSLDAFEAPSNGKYPLTVEQKGIVEKKLLSLTSDEAQLLVNLEFFKDNLKTTEKEKKKADKTGDKVKASKLKQNIVLIKRNIKKTKASYEASSKLVENANKLLRGDIKNINEALADLKLESKSEYGANTGMGGTIKEEIEIVKDDKTPTADNVDIVEEVLVTEKSKATNTIQSTYPKTFKVAKTSNPREEYNCNIIFDGYDKVQEAKRKQVESQYLFGYSQEKMKSYFKNDDFIKCNASLAKIGKNTFLTLNFRVKSKDAQKTYGMLQANETIRLQMVNGNKIYCKNVIQDQGTIEAYTGNTLYTGVFLINKDDLGTLKKGYLDSIGVLWSSGFEEYEIFEVDFIKNQLACLEK